MPLCFDPRGDSSDLEKLVLEFPLGELAIVVRGEDEVDAEAEPWAFVAVSSLII